MSFCQLHIHTLHSRLDAIPFSSEYVQKAKEYNHPSLAITDHGRLNGIYQHQQACVIGGIKPILGIEMYIAPELTTMVEDKRKRTKDQHIILLAQNKTGYQNLLYLNYLSMSDDTHFYYSPRINLEELFSHSEGLYCGTACIGSPFGAALREGNEKKATGLFEKFLDVFKDRMYAEIQLNELVNPLEEMVEGQKTYNKWVIDNANKHGVPTVLTGDVHYVEQGQDKLQTLSIAIRDKATIDKLTFELESKNLYYHNITDYQKFNSEFKYGYSESFIDECYNNSGLVADKIEFKIPERTKMILPTISEDDEMLLIQKAKDGLSSKFELPFDDCPPEYKKRLITELSVIIRKGFCNYMLILEDVFRFAKEKEITSGPGRGCFTHDNQVLLSNGSYKKIGEVIIGDIVISGNGTAKQCINKFEYDVEEELIEIELEDGRKIECTQDHKFLVKRNNVNMWIEAKNLTEQDNLVKVAKYENK